MFGRTRQGTALPYAQAGNVLERLAHDRGGADQAVMMAAYKPKPKQGMAQMNKQAQWLEQRACDRRPRCAEGLHETFTVNALGCRRA